MQENELTKSTKLKIVVLTLIVIFAAITGTTYAYFTIQVSGNDAASSIEVVTANLNLIYTDTLRIQGTEVYPGWSKTKQITVQNNSTDLVYYDIIWRELYNQITNNELKISATCVASIGSCNNISSTTILYSVPMATNLNLKEAIAIEAGATHTYTVTVSFLETGSAQDYNQGKSFYGTLNIAEHTDTYSTSRYLIINVPSNIKYVKPDNLSSFQSVSNGSVRLSSYTITNKVTYHSIKGYDSNHNEVFNKVLGFRTIPSYGSNYIIAASTSYIDNDIINVSSDPTCLSLNPVAELVITFNSSYNVSSVAESCSNNNSATY